MWIQFSDKFDFTPARQPRTSLAYRADGGPFGDGRYSVTRECGRAAKAAGRAVDVATPSKEELRG